MGLIMVLISLLPAKGFTKDSIILLTFGTTTNASETYEYVDKMFKKHFKDYNIEWAYASKIISNKENLPSLSDKIVELQEKGYNRFFVQPLFIYRAFMYHRLKSKTAKYNDRIYISEPLLYRKEDYVKSLQYIEKYFIKDGLNLIVGHGTKKSLGDYKKIYEALDKTIKKNYKNAILYTIDGFPGESNLKTFLEKDIKIERLQVIPFMFVAGDHIINDILGEKDSLKSELSGKVDSITAVKFNYKGKYYYMGLGFNKNIIEMFINKLEETINNARNRDRDKISN